MLVWFIVRRGELTLPVPPDGVLGNSHGREFIDNMDLTSLLALEMWITPDSYKSGDVIVVTLGRDTKEIFFL